MFYLSRLSECYRADQFLLVSYRPLAINFSRSFSSTGGAGCLTQRPELPFTFLCYCREIVIAATVRRRTFNRLSKQKLRFR